MYGSAERSPVGSKGFLVSDLGGTAELAGEVVFVEWVAEDVDVVVGAAAFERVDAEEPAFCCLVDAGAEDGDAEGDVGEFGVGPVRGEGVAAGGVVEGLAARRRLSPRVVGDRAAEAAAGVGGGDRHVAAQVRVGP